MFRRKLTALGFHHPDTFNVQNEQEFRNLIIWLEDQKIRYHKIEDRVKLRNIASNEWPDAFGQYLSELQCPVIHKSNLTRVDWLLGYAVRLEYSEKAEQFNAADKLAEDSMDTNNQETEEGLLDLSADNADLKAGAMSIAKVLDLPDHYDHFVLLQAIRSLIEYKLSKPALSKVSKEKKAELHPVGKTDLGFDTGDSAVNEAAKILRLLHISELRDLQTRINESIVKAQSFTANPKTDQRLGKVGR